MFRAIFIYLQVFIYIHIYIYTCFYLYHARTCICIDIPTHVLLCFSDKVWVCYVHQRLRSMYLCIHVSLQICILLYILIDTLYICTYVYIYVYMCIRRYVFMMSLFCPSFLRSCFFLYVERYVSTECIFSFYPI
jgi:hypothetical protein